MTMGRTVVSYPAAFAVCIMCIGLLYPISTETAENKVQIINKWKPDEVIKGDVGKNISISCLVSPATANVTWMFNNDPLESVDGIKEMSVGNDGEKINYKVKNLTIINATVSNAGVYTCVANLIVNDTIPEVTDKAEVTLDLYFPAKFINGSTRLNGNMSESSSEMAWCIFEAYNVTQVNWYKQGLQGASAKNATRIGLKQIISHYPIPTHREEDNGTYTCEIIDRNITLQGQVHVFVYAPPKVIIDTAIGISTTQIYLKWRVYTYNSRIKNYNILMKKDNVSPFIHYALTPRISPENTSYVINGLQKSTEYFIRLDVETDFARSILNQSLVRTAKTLDFDPVSIPKISINGFSATSVTIGLKKLQDHLVDYIHYYILEAKKKDSNVTRRAYHSRDDQNLPYMFDNLEPHSTYIFKVRACSEYTGLCGNWSEEMEAATSDGMPSKPTKVVSTCWSTFLNLTWSPPERPNAEIKGYTMELTGNATYRDRNGKEKQVTWGPLSKFTTNESTSVRFDDLQPNTQYTVRLSAMTRTRRRGDEAGALCRTLPAPPDQPPRPRWKKILQDEKYMFRMFLPRVSERNGPLCCYRVYMVRLLPNSDWKYLPPPKDINVLEHKTAHASPPVLGAYITDIFSNDNFPLDSELVIGDGKSQFNIFETIFNNSICSVCLKGAKRSEPTTTTVKPSTTTEEDFTADPEDALLDDTIPDLEERSRRSYDNDYASNPTLKNGPPSAGRHVADKDIVQVSDGPLDTNANYTLFVELITQIQGEPSMYSDYVNVLMPAATPPIAQPTSAVEIALQVTCAVAALVLLLMILFCIRQTRRSRKMPHPSNEMGLLPSVRNLFKRPTHIPSTPPDMAPIPKDELVAAYEERQVDSDYGFQKEFELLQLLPECFPDRTTNASEARENQPKNRYPDIKAYDQTRVKLSQIDGVAGSDYINANYVMGYQERKQFICAQGPTDTTVNDFWRMVWEHGLELIVMLTNLEEYSKVKCSKYWPDEVKGSRAFGGLTVHHVTEKRYSDYIVRELKITKQPLNSEGQPIVEGNGIVKRNGDCKDASESVPTSPREVKEPESRIVKQYHFLMWKDFAAPEHAYSILKFIKRVNEAWSGMLNRACVVHCSAGVGRTGTLVALDCLLEQMKDVGHVAVFNTVAELRRSRNFLVQSLKQYVFVYRALVEYAHYDDTEIPAHRLKSSLDRLRNTPQQATSCLMEIEFDKILNSPIPEPIKSCAAGAAEELRAKNRSADVLPYDRNRVILAPIPGRDYSTYINASFIEAYDNSEGFIITQDPMTSTIMDFWRMVSEHNVTTIVMLSELGEGKCPRYWDDGTAQYEHISVQYEESESCPYYTRRQFRVVNNKSGCATCVRQLQYQGWPTAPGHVPEVTRGLAELADAAPRAPGAMLVHCHLGTERSALFVALCILICQLRTERRVDVCCVARKVRSQRVKTIDTFLQYEFLHRAILNYAELHNLLEDS